MKREHITLVELILTNETCGWCHQQHQHGRYCGCCFCFCGCCYFCLRYFAWLTFKIPVFFFAFFIHTRFILIYYSLIQSTDTLHIVVSVLVAFHQHVIVYTHESLVFDFDVKIWCCLRFVLSYITTMIRRRNKNIGILYISKWSEVTEQFYNSNIWNSRMKK